MAFTLETGRTHQIRVHMASIGHPIIGDPVYGLKKDRFSDIGGQCLHASHLTLTHPRTGEKWIFLHRFRRILLIFWINWRECNEKV